MNLELDFTEQEMVSFLEGLGYTVQIEEVKRSILVYHNKDVDIVTNMWVVRDENLKIINKTYSHGMNDWLENAFSIAAKKKLKSIILN